MPSIFVAATITGGALATLSALTAMTSRLTGMPEATVFAYARFAREAGLIAQTGRGRGGAQMTSRDAANLIIAIAGTAVTREAARAIDLFRPMKGTVYVFRHEFSEFVTRWLEPLGLRAGKQSIHQLEADLGAFVESLIEQARDGSLAKMLREIPTVQVPSGVWREVQELREFENFDVERLLSEEIVSIKLPKDVEFGEDILLSIKFIRTEPRVDVQIHRMWESIDDVVQITFKPARATNKRSRDLTISALVTELSLMGLGLTLSDIPVPSKLKTTKEFAAYFARLESADYVKPKEVAK